MRVHLVEGHALGQRARHALAPLPSQAQRRKVGDQQRGAGVLDQLGHGLQGVACGAGMGGSAEEAGLA